MNDYIVLEPPNELPDAITDEDSDVDDTGNVDRLPRRLLLENADFTRKSRRYDNISKTSRSKTDELHVPIADTAELTVGKNTASTGLVGLAPVQTRNDQKRFSGTVVPDSHPSASTTDAKTPKRMTRKRKLTSPSNNKQSTSTATATQSVKKPSTKCTPKTESVKRVSRKRSKKDTLS